MRYFLFSSNCLEAVTYREPRRNHVARSGASTTGESGSMVLSEMIALQLFYLETSDEVGRYKRLCSRPAYKPERCFVDHKETKTSEVGSRVLNERSEFSNS